MTQFKIEVARPTDEALINACAKMSPFTRDFTNPPMSLKQMRKEAFPNLEVLVAVAKPGRSVLGFCWARPMKPKHMPFSTVYYIGVLPGARKLGIASALVEAALLGAKDGTLELVTEDHNEPAMKFFASCGAKVVRKGTVGKDNRPTTRWRIER